MDLRRKAYLFALHLGLVSRSSGSDFDCTREKRLNIELVEGGIGTDGFMAGQVFIANVIVDDTLNGDESDSDEM